MRPYDTVEALIDKYGVVDVLIMIASVMHDKAQHIQAEWQDNRLAKHWGSAGNKVQRLVSSLPKIPGIK